MTPDLTPEQKLLHAQYDVLKKEFSELFTQKNDMLMQDESLLTALYLNAVGQRQHQKLCLTVEIKMIMQRIHMTQSYINRNVYPDKKAIDADIEKRFTDYVTKIAVEAQRLALAKEYLKDDAFLPPHLVVKLKEVYKIIVKRLHPDVNPHATEEDKDLLVQAQAAYDMSNLDALNEILLSLDMHTPLILPDMTSLQKQLEKLEKSVRKLESQIHKLEKQFPFSYRDNLYDKKWIKAQQDALDKDIAELIHEKKKYEDYLSLMDDWKPILLAP